MVALLTDAVSPVLPIYTIPEFVEAGKTCTSTELREAGRSARSCTSVVQTFTVQWRIFQNIIIKLGNYSILIFIVLQNRFRYNKNRRVVFLSCRMMFLL